MHAEVLLRASVFQVLRTLPKCGLSCLSLSSVSSRPAVRAKTGVPPASSAALLNSKELLLPKVSLRSLSRGGVQSKPALTSESPVTLGAVGLKLSWCEMAAKPSSIEIVGLCPSVRWPSAPEPKLRATPDSGSTFASGVTTDCGGGTSGDNLGILAVHICMLLSWLRFMTDLSGCDNKSFGLLISSSPDRSTSRDGRPRLPPSTARRIGDGSDEGMDKAVKSPEESSAASNSACPREHKLKSSDGAEGPVAPFGTGN